MLENVPVPDILPRREVPHSPTVGLWAVPVRPPTGIVGFIPPVNWWAFASKLCTLHTVSEGAVGERHLLKRCADVPTAQSTRHDTPTPLTLAGVPVANTTPGRRRGSGIGVPASWHGRQSISPTVWTPPCPEGLGGPRLDCEIETPAARDSSA
jgi:hypothetical protein